MPWYDGMEAEDIGRIQGKGWDKLEGDALGKALFTSYRGLEQLSGTLRGTPVDRLLVLPEGDDPAAWKPVWDKLGVPGEPGKYEIDPALQPLAHAAGLTAAQAKTFAAEYKAFTDRGAAEAATAATEAAQKIETDKAEAAARVRGANEAVMKQQWGVAYDTTLASAKQMAGRLGYTAEDIEAVITSDKGASHLKQWADMAKAAGEAPLHGVNGNTGGVGGGTRDYAEIEGELEKLKADHSGRMMTPDQSKPVFARMAELSRELVASRHARRM